MNSVPLRLHPVGEDNYRPTEKKSNQGVVTRRKEARMPGSPEPKNVHHMQKSKLSRKSQANLYILT